MVFSATSSSSFFISLSNSEYWMIFQFPVREAFTRSINLKSIAGVQPRLMRPPIVRSLGSLHPQMTFLSSKDLIFRFEITLPSILRREYSQTTGLQSLSKCSILQQSSLLTQNSREHREQSMCSRLSQIQCAKSQIGYTLYLLPERGWGMSFIRQMTGSLRVGFFAEGSSLSLSVCPADRFGNIERDYSMGRSRYLFAVLDRLSSSISSCELSQTQAWPSWISRVANSSIWGKQSLAQVMRSGSQPIHRIFARIFSIYSWDSVSGLVSSQRRQQIPPLLFAVQKFILIALTWPMCRYPLGSGGNLKRSLPCVIFKCQAETSGSLHSSSRSRGLILWSLSQNWFEVFAETYSLFLLEQAFDSSWHSLQIVWLSNARYFSLICFDRPDTSKLSPFSAISFIYFLNFNSCSSYSFRWVWKSLISTFLSVFMALRSQLVSLSNSD